MGDFQESLFGCLSDLGTCLVAFCIPGGMCCMQALAVSKASQGKDGICMPILCVCCLGCIGAAINRGKLRQSLNINGNFCKDCFVWWKCAPCAAAQEYREVRKRFPNK